jgi:hypothetical protein
MMEMQKPLLDAYGKEMEILEDLLRRIEDEAFLARVHSGTTVDEKGSPTHLTGVQNRMETIREALQAANAQLDIANDAFKEWWMSDE